MKLFAWNHVDTGAYHGDGVAVVLAETEEQARTLLTAADEGKGKYDYFYGTAGPDGHSGITAAEAKLEVVEITEPRIVLTYSGCDC